jgi:hypothetical protein
VPVAIPRPFSPITAAALAPALLVIPALTSLFSGLPHPVACRADAAPTLTVTRSRDGRAEVAASALVLNQSDAEPASCPGFELLLQVRNAADGRVRVVLPVVNSTARSAVATVDLRVGRRRYPVRVGRVPAGKAMARTVNVVVPVGDTDVTAALILGP